MLLLKLIQCVILALILFVVISQIVIPTIQNRPMFAWFGRQHKLENELAKLNQEKHERELAKTVRKTR